ncbi:uncharacterized protein YceK [Nicoletella semolina]|uniref:Uncharacterized protein YceK n=1 Tax=Nicoletella semolina TaxID=271160 RepID=A0A4R2NB43_9PAST|nr:YceK/YidQ family lipoprotein [Nicoletella semolina]MDH2924038.1 hypothetical protein [Nicoletella semolina]TCP18172.1 uncharacterized protein YceK [Nicoletella semolina]
MKLTAYKWGIILFSLFMLVSCGTIESIIENDLTPYAGVSNDLQAIENGGVVGVLAVIDLPLSFIFDTLMLPATLTR